MTDTVELVPLPLKPGELALVNGIPLKLTEDGKVLAPKSAQVLTRNDLILDPSEANTPTKRIYFMLQAMVLDSARREQYYTELMALLSERASASTLAPVVQGLAAIEALARRGEIYLAMDACRHLIAFDEALMREFPPTRQAESAQAGA